MGQKDITEKLLMDHNDVFADIVNGFLFKGKQIVKPDDLENAQVISQYKADNGKLHEMERDVSKYWYTSDNKKLKISLLGIENQTKVEKNMPFRTFAYDGTAYRNQLLSKTEPMIPVITLTLYLGTSQKWNQPLTIKELFKNESTTDPETLKLLDPYVNEYRMNLFQVAWMPEEDLNYFHSDFRILANFLIQKRKNPNYVPDDPSVIKHVDEMLKLLSVLTGDESYVASNVKLKGREISMCTVAQNLINTGKKEGLTQGRMQEIFSSVLDGDYSAERGAEKLGISVEEFQKQLENFKASINV